MTDVRTPRWRLQLLGPVRLHDGIAPPRPLPTAKLAALLVLLALGGPAPRSRVAAWLWPDVDEAAARRNLRRELARLRDAGAGACLTGDDPQVLALAPAVACDAVELTEALGRAEPDAVAAAETAEGALAAWRGTPADGLVLDGCPAFTDWLAAERDRLQALRLEALDRVATAHEAAGRLDDARRWLEQRSASDPLHEPTHRRLMQWHLAQGRASAALAQYARCRDALARELGVAPAAETEALAEQARGGAQPGERASIDVRTAPPGIEPTPPSTATATAEVAATPLPFSGRDDETATLAAAWQARRPVLIEGEAGVGKTRLASEFAAARGAYALAPCRPGDAAMPYASFKRALRLLAGPLLDAAGLPPWVRAELAHLMPEFGAASQRQATPEDRSRLHEAALEAWRELAAGSFDTVIVDDWHLADADSRVLLSAIATATPEADVPRLVVLLRPELDEPAATALETLRAAGAVHLRLQPLAEPQLLGLVREASGATDPVRFTRRLLAATGGNPFFVSATLAHWQSLGLLHRDAAGHWRTPFDDDTTDYRELPMPSSVRDTLLARARRLPAASRQLLQAAALADEPFGTPLLALAAGLSEADALVALSPAVATGWLRELGGGHAFMHDLLRAALAGALSAGEARLLQRRLALAAEQAGLDAATIARHWEAGGEPRRAVPHRLRAAETALAVGSWDAAQAHWQAVLAAQPDPGAQVAVLRQRWLALYSRDDRPALQACADELQQLADQAAAHPDSARAAIEAELELAKLLSLGLAVQSHRGALERVATLKVKIADDDPLAPQLALAEAQSLNRAGRTDEAEAVVVAALERTAPAPTPHEQASLLFTLVYSLFSRGQPQRALPYARRTLDLRRAMGDRRLSVRAGANLGLVLSAIGDQPRAAEALAEALALARELHMHNAHHELANNLADIRLYEGRADDARALADEALALASGWVRPEFRVYLLGMRVQAAWQRGALGEARRDADAALALAQGMDASTPLLDALSMSLDLFAFVGDADEARRRLALLDARPGPRSPHFEVKLAFNRVRLALAGDDVAAACAALAAAEADDPMTLHEQRDREHAVLCCAEIAAAAGDAAAARHWLQAHPAPAAHVEIAGRRARLALALDPDDALVRQQAAEAAEASTTPRPTALELHRQLAMAGAGPGHAAAAEALLEELACSLAGVDDWAERLRARWRLAVPAA